MEQKIFNEGDRVYFFNFFEHKLYTGIVRIINSSYPIQVDSDEGIRETFTEDGKICNEDKIPTLSHTPYEVIFKGFTQNKPIPSINSNEIIEVSCNKKDWYLRRFRGWPDHSGVIVAGDGEDVSSINRVYYPFYRKVKCD